MIGRGGRLAEMVADPLPAPWIPPAPGFDLTAPILLPSLETLARVLEGLHRL